MSKSFNCASCSAPLEFLGTPSQKCRYCGSTVIAPPELFYGSSSTPFGDFSSLTGKALRIAEINQLVHDGKKIEAIKLFRETFGVGLAEAKHAVERMERGESVDISGMGVQSTKPLTAANIEQVKKIGYTIGGSILVTILISLLFIGGIVIAVIYFSWSAINAGTPGTSKTDHPSTTVVSSPTPVPDMTELLKLGGEGNGAGHFKDNRHVAVDGNGLIYSSDYSPHRIQVFDGQGKFLTQWAPEAGVNLYDLVADRAGNVYVANDKGIFKYKGDTGTLLAKASNVFPRGMALTWDGKLVVTSRKSILILNDSLGVLNEWKDAASSANSTFGFEKIVTDGSGFIYALDDHSNEICKFSSDGKFLDRFKSGANAPHSVAVDPTGRLFISDTNRIFVLDAEGKPLGSLATYQAFGITFDEHGDLFIAARPNVLKYKLKTF